jgi:hypothetical protein
MKRHTVYFWIVLGLFLTALSCYENSTEFENAFEFMTAADMRYYIMDVNSHTHHFMGALEAMRKVGPGNFLVSTGDIDPPTVVKAAIDSILGDNYVWYPVIGNHEIEAIEHVEYLRNYPEVGKGIVNLVRHGPPGCKETTYSFDWENCHFVVLNQYYDGQSDMGTDGDVVPELLQWLEQDLVDNEKQNIFVFGHEPIFSMPDMDNGRLRHFDNSLNKYIDNNIAFLQLLRKFGVIAYVCGHSHNASYANFNGLWQIDTGHSRGLEGISPRVYFPDVAAGIKKYLKSGLSLDQAAEKFYADHPNQKDIRKGLEFMELSDGMSYKKLSNKKIIKGLSSFYLGLQRRPDEQENLSEIFWENANYARSTFIKFYVGKSKVKIEFYRDDGRGGEYSLRKTIFLN